MKRYKKEFKENELHDLSELSIDEIDLTPLEKEVSKRVGVSINFDLRVNKARRDYLAVYSQELVDKTGIFKYVLESCKIKTFSSSVGSEGNEYVWWQTINYRFEYNRHGGMGGNGCDLLTAWYNFTTKKWTFR